MLNILISLMLFSFSVCSFGTSSSCAFAANLQAMEETEEEDFDDEDIDEDVLIEEDMNDDEEENHF